MADFAHLPSDVLLYFLLFLDPQDFFTLSLLSKSFNNLSQDRSFWLTGLQAVRTLRPIACPLNEDLNCYDLKNLRRIAGHTARLEQNWSLPEPQVIGPIKRVHLGSLLDIIFHVPGTNLYLLHSKEDGTVACWDIEEGKAITDSVHVGPHIRDISPGLAQPGKYSMGLLVSREWTMDAFELNRSLVVVAVEYGGPEVRLFTMLEKALQRGSYSYWAVFLTKDVTGVVREQRSQAGTDEPTSVTILVFNLEKNGREIIIQTGIPPYVAEWAEGRLATFVIHGKLYILLEDERSSNLCCCPVSYLLANSDTSIDCWSDRQEIKIAPGEGGGPRPHALGALTADSYFGVAAVSINNWETYDVQADTYSHWQMELRFWHSTLNQPRRTLGSAESPAITVRDYSIAKLPGRLRNSGLSSWQLMLLSHSGRKVLLITDTPDGVGGHTFLELSLASYDPLTATVTTHKLQVPDTIDLSSIYGMSVDDHIGRVTLLGENGDLYAIPYA